MIDSMESPSHNHRYNNLPSDWAGSGEVTLVCFSTEWSGFSIMMKSVLGDICLPLKEQVHLVNVDIDKLPALAGRFDISRVPTLLIFRKDELVERIAGIVPSHQLATKLGDLLGKDVGCQPL